MKGQFCMDRLDESNFKIWGFFHKSAKVHMSVIGIVSSIRLLILAHFWILSMQSQINWQDTLVGMHVCCNKNSLWDIDRNPLALCSITIKTIFSTSDTNLCWYLGEKKSCIYILYLILKILAFLSFMQHSHKKRFDIKSVILSWNELRHYF